ncbi:hypothetical protein M501DRAFT_1010204 [Patellaria atrata CBS 101060]|uniref:Tyrosine specific protein phosphatases domain-containing protein n=1 Tax=Patellaria atrata CBS 101060 TaxID=1346257 RepID=A0A9P4SEQ4_9PEZI|nr:hypothetical protein M501DRAFT_1010204 [Patellaria atrata CBS 101060]
MVRLLTLCGAATSLLLWRRRSNKQFKETSQRQLTTGISDTVGVDPGLLKKHSNLESYTVPGTGITYPGIRTFYRPHPQGHKLPSKPNPLPLLVFVHGLGGSVAQFHPLLTSLVNVAPCLSIDFPGCGLSEFSPKSWEAYTTDALVQLLATVINKYRDAETGQQIVFIGHSMGCSIATLLASSTSPYANLLSSHVVGFVAICPKADALTLEEAKKFKKLLRIPGPIFDLWRKWDRRGGTESASVARFTGPNAENETRKLQFRFNEQSRTPVWRRMTTGILPDYSSGVPKGGLPGREVWAGLALPIFLAAGELDKITPASELEKIAGFLGKSPNDEIRKKITRDPSMSGPEMKDDRLDGDVRTDSASFISSEDSDINKSVPGETLTFRRRVLKKIVFPAPASHALLYAPSTCRTLAGLIQAFFTDHIDKRLSLGWQLQYLTTEGKWDVKNLEKWKAVKPVSEPIADIFRAMKTLREVDEYHCPRVFVEQWKEKIYAIVDISHESPVYDPRGLEIGGIEYHKFPTVSKLPPSVDEVKSFIDLIDGLRGGQASVSNVVKCGLIGVHCHYGFNRTGFFIVCYLVERLGYRLQDALDEFEGQRPPGIRHDHFIDTLFVRYCTSLKRAPTL